jgi:hypothetical protein
MQIINHLVPCPLLSAAALAGPVAVLAKPLEVNPLPFPNLVALYFQLMGALTCSVRNSQSTCIAKDGLMRVY